MVRLQPANPAYPPIRVPADQLEIQGKVVASSAPSRDGRVMGEAEARGRLPSAFYGRDAPTVARELLGRRLVRVLRGQRLSGLICETEAYRGAMTNVSCLSAHVPQRDHCTVLRDVRTSISSTACTTA